MSIAEEKNNFRVAGEIKRVVYENAESGFGVIKLVTPEGNRVQACGTLAGLQPGQSVELFGKFESHPDFGEEFKVDSVCVKQELTSEGIKRFLAASVPGIGSRTAAKIVDHFGKDTLEILQNFPRRLCEIPRIGAKKAEEISKVWKESAGRRESLIFLQGLGISPAYCSKLLAVYGGGAAEIVKKNPYRLAEDVAGIGFLKADVIARSLGFAEDSTERLTAAAVFCINNFISSGHVCAERGELELKIAELTGRSPAEAARGVEAALTRRVLRLDRGMIYSPRLLIAESRLAQKLLKLQREKRFSGKSLDEKLLNKKMSAEQAAAVTAVRTSPVTIITGGPGVGKTTVVGELVARALKAGLKLMLAAPTGRAAKRMSEATGCAAKTIHRLLMYDPGTNQFSFNGSNHLECDLLIVDECSMLDIVIADALFDAVAPGCSVVLVGDADQLPSVGPGRVLNDLMQSKLFPVSHLTQVFRQASGSQIIANAHQVNRGVLPKTVQGQEDTDFYWIEQPDPEKAVNMISRMVSERIPLRFGFNAMTEVQVLSPMNRGVGGTENLNMVLAQCLNPDAGAEIKVGERIFRKGDKVMQVANNYDKAVFNGDFGKIVYVDAEKRRLSVQFDGERFLEYTPDELDQLSLAYAVTIHKSQGSEFPAVIVPLLNQHFVMLQRNLLYTAMTRAKKLLVLIGSRKALEMAVANIRQEPRWSLLLERLQGENA